LFKFLIYCSLGLIKSTKQIVKTRQPTSESTCLNITYLFAIMLQLALTYVTLNGSCKVNNDEPCSQAWNSLAQILVHLETGYDLQFFRRLQVHLWLRTTCHCWSLVWMAVHQERTRTWNVRKHYPRNPALSVLAQTHSRI